MVGEQITDGIFRFNEGNRLNDLYGPESLLTESQSASQQPSFTGRQENKPGLSVTAQAANTSSGALNQAPQGILGPSLIFRGQGYAVCRLQRVLR